MSELDQARAEIQRLRQVIRQAQNALLTETLRVRSLEQWSEADDATPADVAYSILAHGVHDR